MGEQGNSMFSRRELPRYTCSYVKEPSTIWTTFSRMYFYVSLSSDGAIQLILSLLQEMRTLYEAKHLLFSHRQILMRSFF